MLLVPRNLVRLVYHSVKLFPVLCLLTAWPLSAQSVDDVFARLDKSAQGFKTLGADIKQTAHTAIVNDDSTENGTIRLKRVKVGETHILVDFTKPDPKTVSIAAGEVRIYIPKAKTVQVYDLRSKRSILEQGMLLGFGATSAEIKAAYDVRYVGQESISGQPSGHIRLVPKSREVLQTLKSAELWISDALGVPVQQKFITSGNGDYTMIQYTNLKINPALGDKYLKLSVPKDVQIQQIGK